jgi:hypothetical protein
MPRAKSPAIPETFGQRVKKWSSGTKRALVVICILVGAITLFNIIGTAITAPINTARGFYRAQSNGDWGRAYDFFSLEERESDFINRESFIRINQNVNVSNVRVSPTSYGFFGLFYRSDSNPLFSVNSSADGNNLSETLRLNRIGSSFLFFSAYDVDPANYIVSDYAVSVLPGATVHVDDISVSANSRGGNASGSNVSRLANHTIPRIFRGQYELRVEHPVAETVTQTIQVGGGTRDNSHTIETMRLLDSVRNDLDNQTEDFYRQIVESASSGQWMDSLGVPFSQDTRSEWGNDFGSQYENLMRSFTGSDHHAGLRRVDITNIRKTSNQRELDSSLTYSVEMRVEYDYVRSVQTRAASTDWWSGTTTPAQFSDEMGSSETTITFTYVYENNTWAIQSLHLGRIGSDGGWGW